MGEVLVQPVHLCNGGAEAQLERQAPPALMSWPHTKACCRRCVAGSKVAARYSPIKNISFKFCLHNDLKSEKSIFEQQKNKGLFENMI